MGGAIDAVTKPGADLFHVFHLQLLEFDGCERLHRALAET